MNKWKYWLLAMVLLLCGCSFESEQTNQEPEPEQQVETTAAADNESSEEKSEAVMNEPIVNIEEFRQAAAGTIIVDIRLEAAAAQQLFYQQELSEPLFERIYGKSYKDYCSVSRTELVYLRVLHRGFDGAVHIGELIVHQEIAEDLLAIFWELYQADYAIEKILLIDNYDADDEASMADNNSSAFNYRTISHSDKLSNHSYGKAVDINPLYNPYVKTVSGELVCEPADGSDYIDREQEFPHKIDHDDLCYRLFSERGFVWGGDWENSKDYQHFEKQQ